MGLLTLSIGDIHGESNWKKLGDIQQLLDWASTSPKFDKYIFVGDYVDSFYISDEEMLSNLIDIFAFKRAYPSYVELLLGNHDVQYLFQKNLHMRCTGFREHLWEKIHDLFIQLDKDYPFNIAYGHGRTLWTHAGINAAWAEKVSLPDRSGDAQLLANDLNNMFGNDVMDIYDVGILRGGMEAVGGPLWLHSTKLYRNPLKGYNQVVGHTEVNSNKFLQTNGDNIAFIDSLASWDPYSPLITEKVAREFVLYVE